MNKKPWWVFDPPRMAYVVVSSARKRYIWAFPRFRCRSVIRLTAAPALPAVLWRRPDLAPWPGR